jgi:hypothetical protein
MTLRFDKSLSITQVLLCGAAIVTLSMGIRHGFGLWLQPITQAAGLDARDLCLCHRHPEPGLGRGRHLCRHGGRPVRRVPRAGGGSLFYAPAWLAWRWPPPAAFTLTAGVLMGAAQAGTTYAVVYGVIGRNRSGQAAPGPWAWRRRPARSGSS